MAKNQNVKPGEDEAFYEFAGVALLNFSLKNLHHLLHGPDRGRDLF